MEQKSLAKKKGIADIVFLLDVSGSMQPCIDGLKNNISTFIDYLTTPTANNQTVLKEWRIKIAGYSDYKADGDQWWQEFPFSNDANQVKDDLQALQLRGGGDEPESLLDGLWKLTKLPEKGRGAPVDPNAWRHRADATRVVVVFTDATYHPQISLPEAGGARFEDLNREVAAARLILSVFCPEADCYHELAAIDMSDIKFVGDLENAVEKMKGFTADIENFKNTLEQLAKTVTRTSQAGDVL